MALALLELLVGHEVHTVAPLALYEPAAQAARRKQRSTVTITVSDQRTRE